MLEKIMEKLNIKSGRQAKILLVAAVAVVGLALGVVIVAFIGEAGDPVRIEYDWVTVDERVFSRERLIEWMFERMGSRY